MSREAWLSRYEAGETLREIAGPAGVSPGTVLNHLREVGAQVRPRGSPAGTRLAKSAWHEAAVAMRAEGKSLRQIGAAFGVSYQAVSQALARRTA